MMLSVLKVFPSRSGWLRAASALSSTAMASIGSFLLTVAVARSTDVAGVGRFALALSLALLVTGTLRSTHSEILATQRDASHAEAQAAAGLVARNSLVFVLPLLVIAFGFRSWEIAAIALFAPSISLFEHYRYCNIAFGSSWWAGVMELPKVVVALVALIISTQRPLPPVAILAAWLSAASVMAFTTHVTVRARNGFSQTRSIRPRSSLAFGFQFLIGDGAIQLTSVVVAMVAGLAVNGALKGGGTILGPFALVVIAVNSLLIPYFARATDGIRARAAALSMVGSIVIGLLLVGVLFLPNRVGVFLLGETWDAALPVLPMLAADLVATTFGFPPQAALKALLATRALVCARISSSCLRVALVTLAAFNSDAEGVAGAMALSALFSAITWWVVLLHVAPRRGRETIPPLKVNDG